MDKLATIVNSNQNIIFREVYTKKDGDGVLQEYLLPFVPTARAMIAKYSKHHEWKHSVNHPEYIFKEYQLCTILCGRVERTREQRIDWYGWILNVSPFLLFNDPDIS